MGEKLKILKEEAVNGLASISKEEVKDSRQGVIDALSDIMENGTYDDAAAALAYFCQWMHADCEQRTHQGNGDENK